MGRENSELFRNCLFWQVAAVSARLLLKVRAKAMLKLSLRKKGNGLASRHVFSTINLDFVKPRVIHLGWGEYTRL